MHRREDERLMLCGIWGGVLRAAAACAPPRKFWGRKFFYATSFASSCPGTVPSCLLSLLLGCVCFNGGQRVMRSIAKRMSVLEGKLPVRQHHQVATTACTCSLPALPCPQVALTWVQLGWLQGEESSLLELQVQEQGMISSEKTRGGCFRGRPTHLKARARRGSQREPGARTAQPKQQPEHWLCTPVQDKTSGQGKEGHPSVSPPLATPATTHSTPGREAKHGYQRAKSERQVAQ